MSHADYPSQAEVLNASIRAYNQRVQDGDITPFPALLGLLAFFSLHLYMMLPRHPVFDAPLFKYSILAGVASFSAWTWATCTTRCNRLGYCFGILTVWSCLNWLAFVVVNDAKRDFCRIERADVAGAPAAPASGSRTKTTGQPTTTRYVWQPFPQHSLRQRADWVLDLCGNFRGIGWNWQTLDAPGLPDFVLRDLDAATLSRAHTQPAVSRAGCRRYDDRPQLMRDNGRTVAQAAALGLALMAVVAADPYWAGFLDAPPGALEPPFWRRRGVFSAASRRLLVGLMFWNGIRGIYALKNMVLAAVGPKVLGLRGEVWMQPDCGGPFANVLDRGVTGFWGGWWHQTFRFVFQQFAAALLRLTGLDAASVAGQSVAALGVFVASGLLHAAGAHMQAADTAPVTGTFAFFAVQSVACIIEASARRAFRRLRLERFCARPVQQALTMVWVLAWFYATAPLLVRDMVKGGITLFALPALPAAPLLEPLAHVDRLREVLQ